MEYTKEYTFCDEPSDGFAELEDILWFGENVSVEFTIQRYDSGDTMEIQTLWVDPIGRQTDVDEFVASAREDTFFLDFSIELPED